VCQHQGLTPYGPTVIKELLNEAIETGRGQEVRHNIARHFFSFSLNRLTTATAVDSNPAVTQTAEDGHLRHSCSAVEAAVSVESTSRDSAVCIHPLAVQTCQGDVSHQWPISAHTHNFIHQGMAGTKYRYVLEKKKYIYIQTKNK